MTEIYLIRHTQAEGNRYRMLQGSWDGDVTEKGRRQIDALAERFANVPLDAVYASDLSRAVRTAEGAARGKHLSVQTSTALRELDTGPWERQFFGNVMHAQPELTYRFIHDAENWQLDGAETYAQVRRRAYRELCRIAEENDGRTVAVVSHGVTIRCILSEITGIPLADTGRLPIFKNTAVSKLRWDGSGFEIDYMNDDSHLAALEKSTWSTAGDLRDTPLHPDEEKDYYESCYADAWQSVHGHLNGYEPDVYFAAAKHHLAADPEAVLRIWHREEPVGLVDMDPERGAEHNTGWISLLYLKEAYRNRGYGIQLLARPIFFYQDQNRRRLRLQVAEENGIARAFYLREGFHVIGEGSAATGKLLLMERMLGG